MTSKTNINENPVKAQSREADWKNPITGRNFQNDPERDNHLFDVEKVVRSKDDMKALRNILRELKELGGDYGFNSDYKTNPRGKMRCTMHSGRKRKTDQKTFSSRHNDRNFDSDPEHIAKDKSGQNITWSWCGNDMTFDQGELKYYEETFGKQLEQTNQNYIQNRHKERCKTMDQWRKETMHAPEEQILQIGRMEQYPDVEVSLQCFKEYLSWLEEWNEEHGNPFFILNWAMHQDELGAPHFHLRRAWPCLDPKTGLITTDMTKALLKAGVQSPDPEKPMGKRNNPKMTFDKMCREKWISIARSHGLEIEDTPKPKNEVGKDLSDFKREQDQKRNQIYNLLCGLTESNLNIMEEISQWEELAPSIENFSKWTKERCLEARRTYRDDQIDEIVKQFTAAFANSNKAIKDGYDAQIREYDKALNGYTKQTMGGTRRIFGAQEIREMFESATPELLRKIAGVIAEHGCKDVREWMQRSPWYREFELGREAERQLKREREWER
ncbi:MAG: plasmid recombination protein [Treponemataceae bacterium]|nr:plasmid recombination protein [Treponemataceae bacterium]